jgi:hypothetical protein
MIIPLSCSFVSPGEPPTSTDVATADASGDLVGNDRLRPLIAAWLLSFKSPHTVRNYRNDLTQAPSTWSSASWLGGLPGCSR